MTNKAINNLFGTDPDFPGLPYTVSAKVGNIRDNMLAVQKSLSFHPGTHGELECLTRALSSLEDLFTELQMRFAPEGADHSKEVHEASAGNEGHVIMDKATMIDALASQGISYIPQPTTTEVAGRAVAITSTGDPQLDIFDLAAALVDGNISTSVAVAKLMHIAELLVDRLGDREEYEECLVALTASVRQGHKEVRHV